MTSRVVDKNDWNDVKKNEIVTCEQLRQISLTDLQVCFRFFFDGCGLFVCFYIPVIKFSMSRLQAVTDIGCV